MSAREMNIFLSLIKIHHLHLLNQFFNYDVCTVDSNKITIYLNYVSQALSRILAIVCKLYRFDVQVLGNDSIILPDSNFKIVFTPKKKGGKNG